MTKLKFKVMNLHHFCIVMKIKYRCAQALNKTNRCNCERIWVTRRLPRAERIHLPRASSILLKTATYHCITPAPTLHSPRSV